MKDPRLQLRSPALAAILALLLPGAGHWYQGRRFKAAIFFVCITLTFSSGLLLGGGQPVSYQMISPKSPPVSVQMEAGPPDGKHVSRRFGFASQILVGLPALPALIQSVRFQQDPGVVSVLDAPMTSSFVGVLQNPPFLDGREIVPVTGTIELTPKDEGGGGLVTGMLKGKLPDGTPIEQAIGGQITLGRQVFGSPRREFRCFLVDEESGEPLRTIIQGTVERPFIDWFQAPPDNAELDRLHGKYGNRYDFASMLTWVAGLLNLLVIWDALEGPAYGYGDEKPDEEDDDNTNDKDKKKKPTREAMHPMQRISPVLSAGVRQSV